MVFGPLDGVERVHQLLGEVEAVHCSLGGHFRALCVHTCVEKKHKKRYRKCGRERNMKKKNRGSSSSQRAQTDHHNEYKLSQNKKTGKSEAHQEQANDVLIQKAAQPNLGLGVVQSAAAHFAVLFEVLVLADAVVRRGSWLEVASPTHGVHAGGGVQAVVQELGVFAAVHALVNVLDDHLWSSG